MSLSPCQRYTQCVLDLYRRTPGTPGIARRADRRLAVSLHDRQIPLDIVHTALLLAVARRHRRPYNAPPLAPIATLHYFLPIIDELIATPPETGYLEYLRQSLVSIVPALVAAVDHQIP